MKAVLLTLGVLLIAVTVLSEIRVENWWIRIWDFPRHQVAVLAVVVAFGLAWTGGWSVWTVGVLVGLCASAGYQAWRTFSHIPFVAQPEVKDADPTIDSVGLSILTANVLQPNRRAEEFISVVKEYDPDVLLALETDEWWAEQLRELESEYSYGVRYPLDTTYGMILYSRLELVQPQVRFLLEDDIPSIRTYVKLPNDVYVWLHAVHPDPPNPRYATDTVERDAELLIVGREAKEQDHPAIVLGDFNDVAWSHTTRLFRRISGLIDPRVGRGFYNTFHADWPLFRWPMDHIYHSTHFRLGRLDRGPYFGSDHFPMYARLELDPDAELEQTEPTAAPEDEEETAEKIIEAHQTESSHRSAT